MKKITLTKDNNLYSMAHCIGDGVYVRLVDYFFYDVSLADFNNGHIADSEIIGFAFFEDISNKEIHAHALWYLENDDSYDSLEDIQYTINFFECDEDTYYPEDFGITFTTQNIRSGAEECEFIEVQAFEGTSTFFYQPSILAGLTDNLKVREGYQIASIEVSEQSTFNVNIYDRKNDHLYPNTRVPVLKERDKKYFALQIDGNYEYFYFADLAEKNGGTDLLAAIEDTFYVQSNYGELIIWGHDDNEQYRAAIKCNSHEIGDWLPCYKGIVDYDFIIDESIINADEEVKEGQLINA